METTNQRYPDIAMFYTPVLQCRRTRGRMEICQCLLATSRSISGKLQLIQYTCMLIKSIRKTANSHSG